MVRSARKGASYARTAAAPGAAANVQRAVCGRAVVVYAFQCMRACVVERVYRCYGVETAAVAR